MVAVIHVAAETSCRYICFSRFCLLALGSTQVVVLDNGCMCCTVRGDLLGAFASVLDKMEEARAKGEGDDGRRPLDSVLVETTGMADPVPIVRTLLQVRDRFRDLDYFRLVV